MDYSTIVKNAQAATVRFSAGGSVGTGVMIDATHAITAAHVVTDSSHNASANEVATNVWNEVIKVKSVVTDVANDFSIVELDHAFTHSASAKIADTDVVAAEAVFTVGMPAWAGPGAVGWVVETGKVANSPTTRDAYLKAYDIEIAPGFSGGGIFNSNGDLVGLNDGMNTIDYSQPGYELIVSPYFKANTTVHNSIWDSKQGKSDLGITLAVIKSDMAANNATNVAGGDYSLPVNNPDKPLDVFVTPEQLDAIDKIDDASRMSSVVVGNQYFAKSNSIPMGSGTLIAPDLIITNRHVVQAVNGEITIGFSGGEKISGTVLEICGNADLAIVKLATPVDTSKYVPVAIAGSGIDKGEVAYMIGSPADLWYSEGGWQVSAGTGNGLSDDKKSIEVHSYSQPGNSGSGLFDMSGKLAGVLWGGGTGYTSGAFDVQDYHASDIAPAVQPRAVSTTYVSYADMTNFVSKYVSVTTDTTTSTPVVTTKVSDTTTSTTNWTGTKKADVYHAGSGKEVIDLGAGNDTVYVGTGSDTITTGAGSDKIVLNKSSMAEVTDFVRGQDKLALQKSLFTDIPSSQIKAMFAINTPKDGNDHLVFDTATSTLYYDADGNGSAAHTALVHLAGVSTLTTTDIAFIS
ncbi:MAG: hypothetical protein RIR18_2037 [Pseudomonadota bacterium]|jgi:S1-C subfamily serine protease